MDVHFVAALLALAAERRTGTLVVRPGPATPAPPTKLEVRVESKQSRVAEARLKGYEGERAIPYVVRLDFEKDWAVRQRIWSLDGTERGLLLEVCHTALESQND